MCGYCDNELQTRWLQFGVFSPINRPPKFGDELSDETVLFAAELAAAQAFEAADGSCKRTDILRMLNRMSSAVYLLMIEEKARQCKI